MKSSLKKFHITAHEQIEKYPDKKEDDHQLT
jgi:hypothetical protein